MSYGSKAGRARTNSRSPQAHAICDRCGARVNFVDLRWQYDWRGAVKQNLRILVCDRCEDRAQEQLRAIVVPADPTPIINARPQDFVSAETDYRYASTPTVYDPRTGIPIAPPNQIQTTAGQDRTTDPVGSPVGLDPDAQMPLVNDQTWAVLIPILSITANGTTIVSATCSSPHGLQTGAQVAVWGVSDKRAQGFYNVTVLSATAFTWTTIQVIPSGSLLTSTTRIITTNVGLPLDYTQLPAEDGGH